MVGGSSNTKELTEFELMVLKLMGQMLALHDPTGKTQQDLAGCKIQWED